MQAETALELVRHGATLLLLDVPQFTLIGIDTQVRRQSLGLCSFSFRLNQIRNLCATLDFAYTFFYLFNLMSVGFLGDHAAGVVYV